MGKILESTSTAGKHIDTMPDMRSKSIMQRSYKISIKPFPLVLLALFLMLPPAARSQSSPFAVPLDEFRSRVKDLQQQATWLDEENKGLRRMLKDLEDDALYLVVDTENNRLTMRQGNDVVHTAVCGTGSRQFIEEETGRNWYFETPIGSFTVLGKERNPVWIRPDWSYVEENMPIPPENDPDRFVRNVLGKYAILLGNGYKIHGTTFTELLGTHFTHGCISMGDDDLDVVYKSVRIGTKVYIY